MLRHETGVKRFKHIPDNATPEESAIDFDRNKESYRVLLRRMAGADSGLVIVLTIVAFLVGHWLLTYISCSHAHSQL